MGIADRYDELTHAETLGVSYLDDSSVHEQMLRFATGHFRGGHLPLDSWFPFLGLGSPQFVHYQSLPAMPAGLARLLIGPDAAFRWTLYLSCRCGRSPCIYSRALRCRRPGRGCGCGCGCRDVAVPREQDRDRL